MLFINFDMKRMIIHFAAAAATTTTIILPQIINGTTIATTSTNSVTDMQRKNSDLRVRATATTTMTIDAATANTKCHRTYHLFFLSCDTTMDGWTHL